MCRRFSYFAGCGVTVIAFVGFWWFQEPQQSHPPLLYPKAAVNLKTLSISELQAIAIEHFNKDNLSAGCLAVEELLNRERFKVRTQLLAPFQTHNKTSAINFLQGRLAWQSIKTGDKNYSLMMFAVTGNCQHKPDSLPVP